LAEETTMKFVSNVCYRFTLSRHGHCDLGNFYLWKFFSTQFCTQGSYIWTMLIH